MADSSCPRRRSMVMALLATTAAASLLGGCAQSSSLFSRNSAPEEVQMTAEEAAGATTQWAAVYAKNPKDPQMALGYARALRAIGSKDKSIEILTKTYLANPDDGQIAAELGRVALEAGRTGDGTRQLRRSVGPPFLGEEAWGDALDGPLLPFEVVHANAVAQVDVVGGDEDVGGPHGRFNFPDLERLGDDRAHDPSSGERRRDGDGKNSESRSFHDGFFLSIAPREPLIHCDAEISTRS